ncbi:MAG: VOC family protein [Cyanobacteria bacterium P01_C01_bin.89]
MQLNYFVLYVSDLAKSAKFYSSLGFDLVEEQHGQGPKHYSCTFGGITLELYPAGKRPVTRIRLGLERATNPTFEALLNGKDSNVVKDPDGNSVELIQGQE